MTPDAIAATLAEIFGAAGVQQPSPETWQVDVEALRVLVLLSEDGSWLRVLVPIAPLSEVASLVPQLLEANFDYTQETRFALSQGLLWGVFQHDRASLTAENLRGAIARLSYLKTRGVDDVFDVRVEGQIRQVIQAAKLQGQTLEMTLQNLQRFYDEGVLGSADQSPAERERFLGAWERRLRELWDDVAAEDR